MLIPVTHFLYLAFALLLAGVWLSLAPRDEERAALARNLLFGGASLCAAAFARYWGSNEGQGLALVILALLLVSAFAPRATDLQAEESSQP